VVYHFESVMLMLFSRYHTFLLNSQKKINGMNHGLSGLVLWKLCIASLHVHCTIPYGPCTSWLHHHISISSQECLNLEQECRYPIHVECILDKVFAIPCLCLSLLNSISSGSRQTSLVSSCKSIMLRWPIEQHISMSLTLDGSLCDLPPWKVYLSLFFGP
jgi:hypothetical protein